MPDRVKTIELYNTQPQIKREGKVQTEASGGETWQMETKSQTLIHCLKPFLQQQNPLEFTQISLSEELMAQGHQSFTAKRGGYIMVVNDSPPHGNTGYSSPNAVPVFTQPYKVERTIRVYPEGTQLTEFNFGKNHFDPRGMEIKLSPGKSPYFSFATQGRHPSVKGFNMFQTSINTNAEKLYNRVIEEIFQKIPDPAWTEDENFYMNEGRVYKHAVKPVDITGQARGQKASEIFNTAVYIDEDSRNSKQIDKVVSKILDSRKALKVFRIEASECFNLTSTRTREHKDALAYRIERGGYRVEVTDAPPYKRHQRDEFEISRAITIHRIKDEMHDKDIKIELHPDLSPRFSADFRSGTYCSSFSGVNSVTAEKVENFLSTIFNQLPDPFWIKDFNNQFHYKKDGRVNKNAPVTQVQKTAELNA
ncbi:MAG: hypothetical protein ACT4OY_08600 [Alphaproteobacteria bacterium]